MSRAEAKIFNINEGLGLLKLADTVLILINPSPSNVNFKMSSRCLPIDEKTNDIFVRMNKKSPN